MAVSRFATTNQRLGYLIAAAVNAVLMWIVNSLQDWDWPPFLTAEFSDLLPYLDATLIAAIAVNLIWAWNDAAWLRDLGQLATNVVSLVAVVRAWQLFPFDLSDYWGGWQVLARVLLGVAAFGLIVGALARLGHLIADGRGPARRGGA